MHSVLTATDLAFLMLICKVLSHQSTLILWPSILVRHTIIAKDACLPALSANPLTHASNVILLPTGRPIATLNPAHVLLV